MLHLPIRRSEDRRAGKTRGPGIGARWLIPGCLIRFTASALYSAAVQLLWRVNLARLFDRGYYSHDDVIRAGMHPIGHYLLFGAREGRNPAILFDTRFYMSKYPDVATSGINPLVHYLRFGGRELRQPHLLFDAEYYIENNPEARTLDVNPLVHFLRSGGREGRSPHPWFDAAFYLEQNEDVRRWGGNPLLHYLSHGAAEGRDPHPAFSTARYVARNSRKMPAGINPLVHFLEHGAIAEAHVVENSPISEFLPRNKLPKRLSPLAVPVDVVIPVYKGLTETRACLESVLRARCIQPYRLIIVNDRSPDGGLSEYLRSLTADPRIVLIEHDENLGFVQSANAGMSRSRESDVVLLNSDTLVANDWLDRLTAAAYSRPRAGTVTPFSNNATICSYPRSCEDNELPAGQSVEALDGVFKQINAARTAEVPTAVGFCMYIRRDCLADTGLFDQAAFGKGYGEENEFCMRAARRGWVHLLAADTFVYHAGGVSFSDRSARLRQTAMETLRLRYPGYEARIRRHVDRDPAKPYRFAVTAHRIANSGKPVILMITHAHGGGVEQHVRQLTGEIGTKAHVVTLQASSGCQVVFKSETAGCEFSIRLDGVRQYDALLSLIRSCGVTRLHIHHVMDYAFDVRKLSRDLNVPVDFTVHDYYALCPHITLTNRDGKYCGEPVEQACDRCIAERLPQLGMDIGSWRRKHAWLFTGTDRVITPSADALHRIERYFPNAPLVAAGHPLNGASHSVRVSAPLAAGRQPLSIAMLGVMSVHKGFNNLRACARIASERGLPLRFTLVGYLEPHLHVKRPLSFSQTGRYELEELPEILACLDPHVVWFPMQCPETFSYALSTCLSSGLPVAVPGIGAFPERVAERPWSWTIPWDLSPERIVEFFVEIRKKHFATGEAPSIAPPGREAATTDFYAGEYLARPSVARSSVAPASAKARVVAVASSHPSGQFDACAYIRLVLPLTHPSVSGRLELIAGSIDDALTAEGDIVVVQRAAVPDVARAEKLLERCARAGMRLVYESDDDLFNLPPDHNEYASYRKLTEPARLLARHADTVVVSTAALRERLLVYNSHVAVLPNGLDERLWFDEAAIPRAGSNRILYMGTLSHGADLELVREPMRRLRSRMPDVEFDVVGVVPPQLAESWFRVIELPPSICLSYPSFVRWLKARNRWSIGLAPLRSTAFNACKSHMKYLDYGGLGLAGVYSLGTAFDGSVRHGETGLLAGTDSKSWAEAITELVRDSKLRVRLQRNANEDVRRHHTLEAQSEQRRQVWNRILSEQRDEMALPVGKTL